jgi:hypothetical protein
VKKLAAIFALLFPLSAFAGTTWTSPDGLTSKAVDTTGTGSAPSAATDGIDLSAIGMRNGFTVVYESTGAAFTACSLQAYVRSAVANSGAGLWVRVPDLDLTVQALTAQGFVGFRVTAPRDRIAFIPNGCAQPGIVWILGTAVAF